MIRVHNLVLGALGTNCYLIQNTETKEVLIVDPAAQPERIYRQIALMEGKPAAILLTHGHFDHMSAADEVRTALKIPIYAHEAEKELLENGRLNLSTQWATTVELEADCFVRNDELLELAGLKIRVLHTPGHTVGSVCYYIKEEKVLFSGDTLFCESYGRYDFPTSSGRALAASIKRLLEKLPAETAVYPGHNESTSIAHEKRYNPLAEY